ncbi:chromate transporter [Propionicimonas paludicola]|uniref:Chromate transporter n=1 Tax=Propionicimonas paludicola TaxID=185243 RepID=A0A2A9CT73_9ACTN|nr:chromate efflux transporter [Propionicimonas paludicola]PFG17634.1 chromate transporter [Propionicimonas paludicola]
MTEPTSPSRLGRAVEVFTVFLGLGLTSFGGPIAHLGYFRRALVERRRWLSETAYADLVALCQFLPGPASSQVGMGIGLQRAGLPGLVAAWLGFTLPSALLMVGFGYGLDLWGGAATAGWVLGLKAAAVGVVGNAVLAMARTLTPDAKRAAIAVAALVAVLLSPPAWTQLVVIAAAGLIGLVWLTPSAPAPESELDVPLGRSAAVVSLALFAGLLVGLPVLAAATGNPVLRLFDDFYRSGSLVFGGGHVVLPLLDAVTVQPGLVSHDTFLAGYGAAQAVPGPLFTFAAFLGYVLNTAPNGLLGAAIALVAIFLPSALLIAGALPFWSRLRRAPRAQAALMGVNAAVVGILAAALYQPVFTSGITGGVSFAIAAVCFVALTSWRTPAWLVVLLAGLAGAVLL